MVCVRHMGQTGFLHASSNAQQEEGEAPRCSASSLFYWCSVLDFNCESCSTLSIFHFTFHFTACGMSQGKRCLWGTRGSWNCKIRFAPDSSYQTRHNSPVSLQEEKMCARGDRNRNENGRVTLDKSLHCFDSLCCCFPCYLWSVLSS